MLFCVRVQMELLQYPWSPEVLALPGMGEIRSLLQERQGRGGKSSEAVVWRGPRVRMGVHCARDYAVERHKLTGALQASGSGLNLANEAVREVRGVRVRSGTVRSRVEGAPPPRDIGNRPMTEPAKK